MATEEELNAWAAGDDVDGARQSGGRGRLSAGWWGVQAAVVGFGSIYLAATSSLAWLVFVPAAAWMAYRARVAARRQRTWERLYARQRDTGATDAY